MNRVLPVPVSGLQGAIAIRRGGLTDICAFWKQDNSGYYVKEFAQLLKRQFGPDAQ